MSSDLEMLCCPYCLEVLFQPILLPSCGHNACQECLTFEFQKQQDKSQIVCKACNQKQQIQDQDISKLPLNVSLQQVISYLRYNQKVLQKQTQETLEKQLGKTCSKHSLQMSLLNVQSGDFQCSQCVLEEQEKQRELELQSIKEQEMVKQQLQNQSNSEQQSELNPQQTQQIQKVQQINVPLQYNEIKDLQNAVSYLVFDYCVFKRIVENKRNQVQQIASKLSQVKQEAEKQLNEYVSLLTGCTEILIDMLLANTDERMNDMQFKYSIFYSEIDYKLEKFQPISQLIQNIEDPGDNFKKQLEFRKSVEDLDLGFDEPQNINLNSITNTNLKEFEKQLNELGRIDSFKLVYPNPKADDFTFEDVKEEQNYQFKFDSNNKASNIEVTENGRRAKWTGGGGFKTIFLDTQLLRGKVYSWSFKVILGTDFKIGVSKKRTNLDSAFSDHDFGWSFYNYSAQLRHHSGSSGASYGQKFQAGDIIKLTVDTVNGTLSFNIKGVGYGPAFTESQKFTDGELWPAVCCIENLGELEILVSNVVGEAQESNQDLYIDNFDSNKKSDLIEVKKGGKVASFKGDSHFHTIFFQDVLVKDKNYLFEFKIISGIRFKIGILYYDQKTQNTFKDKSNFNFSFSDLPNGYAWYNGYAELRHGSPNLGLKIGQKIFPNDTKFLYMWVDTLKGELWYAYNIKEAEKGPYNSETQNQWWLAWRGEKMLCGPLKVCISMIDPNSEIEIISAQKIRIQQPEAFQWDLELDPFSEMNI